MSMHRYQQTFIDTVSRPKFYLPLLAAFALMFVWMMVPALPYSAADFAGNTNDGSSLDMATGYTHEEAYEKMEGYGADGRAYYVRKLLINDTVFPIAYSLLFAGTLAILLKRLTAPESRFRYLVFLPLAGGVCDLLENAGILTMLLSYPARLDWLATVTSLITTIKLGINISSMVLIVASLAVVVYSILQKAGRSRRHEGGLGGKRSER